MATAAAVRWWSIPGAVTIQRVSELPPLPTDALTGTAPSAAETSTGTGDPAPRPRPPVRASTRLPRCRAPASASATPWRRRRQAARAGRASRPDPDRPAPRPAGRGLRRRPRRLADGDAGLAAERRPAGAGAAGHRCHADGVPRPARRAASSSARWSRRTPPSRTSTSATGRAYFVSGAPHFVVFEIDGDIQGQDVRLAGNVLLWQQGDTVLRLEADVHRGRRDRLATLRAVAGPCRLASSRVESIEGARGLVLAVGGGLAAVRLASEERLASFAGRLDERPVAGDLVQCTVEPDGARIDVIEPRRSSLVRLQVTRGGRVMGEQVVAANADLLLAVVAAVDPPLRRGLIDRLLVAAWSGNLAPAIVVTKADLPELPEEPVETVLADYVALGVPSLAVDGRTAEGVAAVARADRRARRRRGRPLRRRQVDPDQRPDGRRADDRRDPRAQPARPPHDDDVSLARPAGRRRDHRHPRRAQLRAGRRRRARPRQRLPGDRRGSARAAASATAATWARPAAPSRARIAPERLDSYRKLVEEVETLAAEAEPR